MEGNKTSHKISIRPINYGHEVWGQVEGIEDSRKVDNLARAKDGPLLLDRRPQTFFQSLSNTLLGFLVHHPFPALSAVDHDRSPGSRLHQAKARVEEYRR